MSVPREGGRFTRAFIALGVALVLLASLLLARLPLTPLPYWDSDPLFTPPALAEPKSQPLLDVLTASLDSVGPTASVTLCVAGLCGAALVLALSPRGMSPLAGVLGLVGSAALLWGLWREPSMERTRLACHWLLAIWGGMAVWHLGADRRWRALVLGLLLGFLVVLTAKGVLQVAVEHSATVATFEEDRATILRSRGWEVGSPAALAYERRLRQPEATGWFGLSNVYATFMACGLVAGTGLWTRTRRRDTLAALGAGALALACLTGLALSRSKGGIAAAGAGFAVLGLAAVARKRGWAAHPMADRIAGLLAVGCGVAALFAVAARGVLGTGLSELSLLFRWYYLEASSRILMQHPLTGVGPDGFQAAYARFKNPLSPEEVTSPHSIGADFLCTLGIAGLAWVMLLAWWTHRAGPGLLASPGDAPAHEELKSDRLRLTRPRVYAMLAVLAGVTLLPQVIAPATTVALTVATQVSPVDPVPAWAMGLGLGAEIAFAAVWGLLAWCLARSHFAAQGAAAAGAVVLWTHAQIEMTPVQASSAPLFMMLLAGLVSPAKPRRGTSPALSVEVSDAGLQRFSRLGVPLACTPLLYVTLILIPGFLVYRTEKHLLDAAREVSPVGEILRELRLLESSSIAPRQMARALEDLDARLIPLLRNSATPLPTFEDRLAFGARQAASIAADRTAFAAGLWAHNDLSLDQLALRRALAVLATARTSASADAAQPRATSSATSALILGGLALRARPDHAGLWLLLGDVLIECRRAGLDTPPTTDPPSWPAETPAGAWRRAHELDPHSPAPVDRLLDEALRSNDPAEAGRWADVRLELDENARLDRTRRLSDRERAWLVGIAGGRDMGPRPGVRSAGSPPPGS